jgi:hypothetical protein
MLLRGIFRVFTTDIFSDNLIAKKENLPMMLKTFQFDDCDKCVQKESELHLEGFYLTNRKDREDLHPMEYIKTTSSIGGTTYTIVCRFS